MKKKRPIPRHLRIVKQPPEIPEVAEIDDLTDANVRAAFIVRFGPECAAWLCNRFRHHLRRIGYFVVHMPPEGPLPAWIDIAICYLEMHREKSWKVQRSTIRGVRYFRVYWNGKKRDALPPAIVPVGQA